jgi:hypothetical protein
MAGGRPVPESRRRKKKTTTRTATPTLSSAQPQAAAAKKKSVRAESPPWFGWMLLGFFAVGIAWLLTYYFSNGTALGMDTLGGWNVAIGFAFILAGLGLATQWK